MKVEEVRDRYIRFFEARGHAYIPSASLVPDKDSNVLFNTAGMQPLIPFLSGEPHPKGKRLVNYQKCLRTKDIDLVGDSSHLTFFEMLGNWSLGDYFKEESLTWSYEFLTQELGIDPARLAVTVFAGDQDAPRDDESAVIWERLGLPTQRIYFLPKADNWWGPANPTGPCGPDSEIFFDTGLPDHPSCQPGCSCGKWIEIWNNVFMEYEKHTDGTITKLTQRNVDTGMGLERITAVLQGHCDVYQTENLLALIKEIEKFSSDFNFSSRPSDYRIIADHIRAATFAIADGVYPNYKKAGYVVRRLIRAAVYCGQDLGFKGHFCSILANVVIRLYGSLYPELNKPGFISYIFDTEEDGFSSNISRGRKTMSKTFWQLQITGQSIVPGTVAFQWSQTYGLPLPVIVEQARLCNLSVDEVEYHREREIHRRLSCRGRIKSKGV